MTEEKKLTIPLNYLIRAQYGLSYRYLELNIYIKIIIFVVNIFMMHVPNIDKNLFLVWCNFFISVFVVFLDFWLRKLFGESYKLAEEARKKNLLYLSLNIGLNKSDERHLRASFKNSIYEKAFKYYGKGNEILNSQSNDNKIYNFAKNIQENVFYTSVLMRKFSKRILPIIIFMVVFIIFIMTISFIFMGLYSKDFSHAINTLSSKQLSMSINILFTLNIISYFLSYESTGKLLKSLDSKLENIEITENNALKIMIIFDEYNSILATSYPIPDKFYKKHEEELKVLWQDNQNKK